MVVKEEQWPNIIQNWAAGEGLSKDFCFSRRDESIAVTINKRRKGQEGEISGWIFFLDARKFAKRIFLNLMH